MEEKKNDKNEFLKKNILIYFLYFIGLIVSFPIKIVYSRTLLVEDFGAFFAMISVIIVLSPISNLGFSESLNYFIPKYKEKKEKIKKIINTSITIQILGSLFFFTLFFIFSKQIAIYYLKKESYTIIIKYLSILLLLIPLSYTLMNLYRSIGKEEYYIYIDITKNTLILLGSIALISLNLQNIKNYSLIWIIAFLLTTTFYLTKFFKITKNRIKIYLEKKTFKEILDYSYINFLGSSIAILFTYTDTIMITLLLNSKSTGYYNAILPIASLLLITVMPLSIILYPRLSKLHHEKKEAYYELKQSITLVTIINSIIFSILYFNSEKIIYLLLGENYLVSNTVLLVLLIAFFINSYNLILHILFSSKGYVKERLKVLLSTLTINIILNYILIKKYDILGAATATLTSFIIMNILYLYFLQKKQKKTIIKELKTKSLSSIIKKVYYTTITVLITLKITKYFLLNEKIYSANEILNLLLRNITLLTLIIVILIIFYYKELKPMYNYIISLYNNFRKK